MAQRFGDLFNSSEYIRIVRLIDLFEMNLYLFQENSLGSELLDLNLNIIEYMVSIIVFTYINLEV